MKKLTRRRVHWTTQPKEGHGIVTCARLLSELQGMAERRVV
jgi:hypothetical protein